MVLHAILQQRVQRGASWYESSWGRCYSYFFILSDFFSSVAGGVGASAQDGTVRLKMGDGRGGLAGFSFFAYYLLCTLRAVVVRSSLSASLFSAGWD